jgi:PAT family beta-lactamase induction signal transducer AmpG
MTAKQIVDTHNQSCRRPQTDGKTDPVDMPNSTSAVVRTQTWLKATAVYREPRVIAILLLGFSSGMPLALTAGTLAIWMAEVGVDLTTIGLFAVVATPYSLKFLWAPIIDRMPLPWLTRRLGRRRAWLLLTQIGLIAAIFLLGESDPIAKPVMTALAALLVAFASASQDIVVDAFRIESLDERQLGAGAAMYVFGYRLAMLVSGAGALWAATHVSWAETYALMAALILVGVVTTLACREPEKRSDERSAALEAWGATHLHREDRLSHGDATARQTALAIAGIVAIVLTVLRRRFYRSAEWIYDAVVCPFAEFMTRRGWVVILLFVVFFKFGDTLAGAMTNPFLVKIGFTKIEIAEIAKVFGFGATMAGLFLGGALINGAGIVRSLWVTGILQLVSNLMFAVQAAAGANLSLLALTIGFENLASGMGTAAFIAYLSSLCNISYTATQYALLTSFMAVARTWLSAPSGWLVEHVDWASAAYSVVGSLPGSIAEQINWIGFFLLTTVAALPGLALLAWVTSRTKSAVATASAE